MTPSFDGSPVTRPKHRRIARWLFSRWSFLIWCRLRILSSDPRSLLFVLRPIVCKQFRSSPPMKWSWYASTSALFRAYHVICSECWCLSSATMYLLELERPYSILLWVFQMGSVQWSHISYTTKFSRSGPSHVVSDRLRGVESPPEWPNRPLTPVKP